MISLLFLISFPFAVAGGQHRFSIKVFTSLDDQFWANSVIIEGAREVMLVDAQLTKTNAERVLEEIKDLSRENRQMEKDLGLRCNLSRCCYKHIRRQLY